MVNCAPVEGTQVHQKTSVDAGDWSRDAQEAPPKEEALALAVWHPQQALLQSLMRAQPLVLPEKPLNQQVLTFLLQLSLSRALASLKLLPAPGQALASPGSDVKVLGLPPLLPATSPKSLSPAPSTSTELGSPKQLRKHHKHSKSTSALADPSHGLCATLTLDGPVPPSRESSGTDSVLPEDCEQACAQPFAPECVRMGVATNVGQRSTMEDFAFAMPLSRPDTGVWFKHGACFGVFDGHGGAEVAQSLAEHLPERIQDSVHHIASAGPRRMGEILLGHERNLKEHPNMWSPSASRLPSHLPPHQSSSLQSFHSGPQSRSHAGYPGDTPGMPRRLHSSVVSLNTMDPGGSHSPTPRRSSRSMASALSMQLAPGDGTVVHSEEEWAGASSAPSVPADIQTMDSDQPGSGPLAHAFTLRSAPNGVYAAQVGAQMCPPAGTCPVDGVSSPMYEHHSFTAESALRPTTAGVMEQQCTEVTQVISSSSLPASPHIRSQSDVGLCELQDTAAAAAGAGHEEPQGNAGYVKQPKGLVVELDTVYSSGSTEAPEDTAAAPRRSSHSASKPPLPPHRPPSLTPSIQEPDDLPIPSARSSSHQHRTETLAEAGACWESAWQQTMQGRDPGSTALVATVIDGRMFVANVGDCRLILAVRDAVTGHAVPVPVTNDHVPHAHPGERARLEALKVPVSKDGYVGPDGGVLQVSRSIGDFHTKANLGEQVILSEPELHTVELGPHHLFAVAASDGITCAMKDDTIINQVCRYLNELGPSGQYNDPNHAAEQLVQYAINSANSADNASAIITCFTFSKPPMPPGPPRRFGGAARSGNFRRESAPIVTET